MAGLSHKNGRFWAMILGAMIPFGYSRLRCLALQDLKIVLDSKAVLACNTGNEV